MRDAFVYSDIEAVVLAVDENTVLEAAAAAPAADGASGSVEASGAARLAAITPLTNSRLVRTYTTTIHTHASI